MRAFVQTRGTARATDYAFLGGAPPEPWWRAYRDATAFDHPTVLVTSDGARWAAYLSGIPSSRVDAVGTVVRYTLVLDGPCGVADAACVPAVAGAWIDDVAAAHGARPGGRLAAALDARFPAADVERWLAEPSPPRLMSDERPTRPIGSDERAARPVPEVSRRAMAALAALAPVPDAPDVPGDWIGAVGAPAPRAAFTSRVTSLVTGTPAGPCCSISSAVRPTRSRCSTPPPPSPCSSRAQSPDWRGAPRCSRWWRQKKSPAPAPPARRAGVAAVAGIAVVPMMAAFGVLAATVLVLTLLVWLL